MTRIRGVPWALRHRIFPQGAHRYLSNSARRIPPTIHQLTNQALDVCNTSSHAASSTLLHDVTLHGWVVNVTKMKKFSFLQIVDGSEGAGKTLQVVVDNTVMDQVGTTSVSVGASVRIQGHVLKSPAKATQKLEVSATSLRVLGESDAEKYPLPKNHVYTAEHLRDWAHLRPRTTDFARMLRLRHAASFSFQSFFNEQDFTFIHAPIITENDCEGAGETFSVTGDASDGSSSSKADPFFGRPAYLTVSSQLHLEAMAASISRVYTLQPAFRAERAQHTGRHLSEFWMLEAEMAFTDSLDGVMDVVETSIKSVLQDAAFATELGPLAEQSPHLKVAAEKTWKRITYTDALELIQAWKSFSDSISWGDGLSNEHERWLTETWAEGVPVFVTDYPSSIKPFYMLPNQGTDPSKPTVSCFDLLVPKVGELVGGSMREHNLERLWGAMAVHGLEEERYKWYLDLRKYGSTPHGGFGMGFERFLSWVSGQANVRECIAAPRWRGRFVL